jgi:hypothetical protein
MLESLGERLMLAALVGAFVVAGCGGDTSGSRPKIGAGGATLGAVGTTAGSATGGSAGAQACLKWPMPNTHISDFTQWEDGVWGYPGVGDLTGGQSLYQSDNSAVFTPSVDLSLPNPFLRLQASDQPGGYSGYVMWFDYCADASRYQGIRFKIRGNLGGATLQFQVQTSTNYPIDGRNQKGECVGGWGSSTCNNNYVTVTMSTVTDDAGTSDWTTAEYTWDKFTGGFPIDHLDPSNILGLQWQANCPTSGKLCSMTIDLDRVEFF